MNYSDFKGHIRTKQAVLNVFSGLSLKAFDILVGLALVPITLDLLGTTNYGVWLTISSIPLWFSFIDGGITNAFRNRLAILLQRGSSDEIRSLISTAFINFFVISSVISLLFAALSGFFDWVTILNTTGISNHKLSAIAVVVFSAFLFKLTLGLVSSIYLANQESRMKYAFDSSAKLLLLFSVALMLYFDESELLVYASIASFLPVLTLLTGFMIIQLGSREELKLTFKLYRPASLEGIWVKGGEFLIIQLGAVVLFSTDSIIITQLLGPENVAVYRASYQYFSLFLVFFSVLTTPFWSAFSQADQQGDNSWIHSSVLKLQKIWLLGIIVLIGMFLISDWFFGFWLKERLFIPSTLSVAWLVFMVLRTHNSVFVAYINGVGKLRIQVLTAITSILVNIPLSIFFAKNLSLGISGVVYATCVSLGISALLRRQQYFMLITGRAKGLWNK